MIKFHSSFFSKKLRIVGLSLFEDGTSPKWEDPKNVNGHIFTLSYEIREREDLQSFLLIINKYWLKLIMIILGESIKCYEYVRKKTKRKKFISSQPIGWYFY